MNQRLIIVTEGSIATSGDTGRSTSWSAITKDNDLLSGISPLVDFMVREIFKLAKEDDEWMKDWPLLMHRTIQIEMTYSTIFPKEGT